MDTTGSTTGGRGGPSDLGVGTAEDRPARTSSFNSFQGKEGSAQALQSAQFKVSPGSASCPSGALTRSPHLSEPQYLRQKMQNVSPNPVSSITASLAARCGHVTTFGQWDVRRK